jgi:hypothetical protein
MNHTTPVIILGAARSGTRLLRSLIASGDQHVEVPYDVNYIWRYGNESCPNDCLAAATVTDEMRAFIRSRIGCCAGALENQPFVEKTVGNILRIPFVKSIYPEAKFLFLVRNGRDVIESAHRCWKKPPAAGYLLDKIKTFPWWTCRNYAGQYVRQIAARSLRLSPQLKSWGPRYDGIDVDVRTRSLLEVCCRQWVACIEAYEHDRQCLPINIRLEVRYEDLINNGAEQAERLASFLDIADATPMVEFAKTKISGASIGTYARLNEGQQCLIELVAGRTLDRWGYKDEHSVAA